LEANGILKTRPGTSESRLDDSARFWTAAALRRFSTGRRATQSGRGLPPSKTLTHNCFAQTVLVATDFLKPLWQQRAAGRKPAMRLVSNPRCRERHFHERQRQAAGLLLAAKKWNPENSDVNETSSPQCFEPIEGLQSQGRGR